MATKTLLVDDKASVRGQLRSSLADKGYHVVEAHNGREALAVSRQEKSTVVLLDLQKTGHDGLRRLPELTGAFDPNTLVIIFTSLGEGMRAQHAIDERASADNPMALERLISLLPERRENGHHSITLTGESSHSQAVLDGRAIDITTFPFSIGRKARRENPPNGKHQLANLPPNDLDLPDPRPYYISRRHFQIEHRSERFFVQDLGSRLGVVVNWNFIGGLERKKIQELREGDNLVVVGGPDSPHRFIVTV